MKKLILLIVLAITFNSCMEENIDGCPSDVILSFTLNDQFVSGDYDSEIGNDVLLYIYKEDECIGKQLIPYNEIKSEKEYRIPKTKDMYGNMSYVAWAVPHTRMDNSLIPDLELNHSLGDFCLEVSTKSSGVGHNPASCDLYLGVAKGVEQVDTPSSYKIGMIHSTCRIEVNVVDMSNTLTKTRANDQSRVVVSGTMTQMNVDLKGVGDQAITPVDLVSENNIHYKTGRFGVMPSSSGQTVSVAIYNSTELVATLNAPIESLPKGAEANDLMIFEYEIGEAYFWITVNGFREKVYDVQM